MIREYDPEEHQQIQEHLDEDAKNYFTSDHYKKYVCFVEDQIAGWTVLEKNSDRLIITWIFVREEYRKQGIGTQLMNKIKEYAQELEVRGISVNTGSNTTWARKFYEKNGFEEVGSVKKYFSFDDKHIFYWYQIQ